MSDADSYTTVSFVLYITQDLEDPIENFSQRNTRYQVARENQQHRDIHENTGSQMESSRPKKED